MDTNNRVSGKINVMMLVIFLLIAVIAVLTSHIISHHHEMKIGIGHEGLIPYQTKKTVNGKDYLFVARKEISHKDIDFCYQRDLDPVYVFFNEVKSFKDHGLSMDDGDYCVFWVMQEKASIVYDLYATENAIETLNIKMQNKENKDAQQTVA